MGTRKEEQMKDLVEKLDRREITIREAEVKL